jgi:hypothetical protein
MVCRPSRQAEIRIFRSNLQTAMQFINADSANVQWQGISGVGYERIGDALMLKRDFAVATKE